MDPAEIERRLLAAACSPAVAPEVRAEILKTLARHEFVHPESEIIFRALTKMPRATPEHIRHTLGAQLTRMGFPDIDIEAIFRLPPPSATMIKALLQQLSR